MRLKAHGYAKTRTWYPALDGPAVRRRHLSEQAVQKAVKSAAAETGLVTAVSPHTFRHSFATHLP